MTSDYEAEKALYRKFFNSTVGRSGKNEEILTTPLFSLRVKHKIDPAIQSESEPTDSDSPSSEATSGGESEASRSVPVKMDTFQQYGLLGHHVGHHEGIGNEEPIFLNIQAPHSAFICGSQGSGKSYTLNAMLENCLLAKNPAAHVTKPLAGVVFHYDVTSTASIAEAAHLCSTGLKVNVFVSPSNQKALTSAYGAINQHGSLTVKPLLFRSSDLNIERMNKLMALAEKEGPLPLYMEVLQRILRQMASEDSFDYANFKAKLKFENLTKDQTGPLALRIGLLESFMEPSDVPNATFGVQNNKKKRQAQQPKLFNLEPNTLTIIDLTDPFVDASTACMLFDITLSLVQEQRSNKKNGLVIALDEAHKFMNKSVSAETFTDRLLTTIREQRHNATRVFIATQEPTISERLLDLCSVSLVHRFTSPAWFGAIRGHLSGASKMVSSAEEQDAIFSRIVDLSVGESLVFAPTSLAVLDGGEQEPSKLGAVAMKIKTRARVSDDGGMSVMASGK